MATAAQRQGMGRKTKLFDKRIMREHEAHTRTAQAAYTAEALDPATVAVPCAPLAVTYYFVARRLPQGTIDEND